MNEELKKLRIAMARIAEVAGEAAGQVSRDEQDDEYEVKESPYRKGQGKRGRQDVERGNPFQMHRGSGQGDAQEHVYGNHVVCDTEKRGYAMPDNRDMNEIRVDATDGFIPLWEQNTTLKWRFRERSMRVFENPRGAMAAIERLFGQALAAWGDAAPVRFAKSNDAWDFEFVMRRNDDCDANGCVLASAFFPGAAQQKVYLYPKMFEQSREEQIETLVHEFGHVFGLRHFFANITETRWRSELFGTDSPFSIMNYGDKSHLTEADKSDLKRLYAEAWRGALREINGTPIRFVKSFQNAGVSSVRLAAAVQRKCGC